MAEYTAYCWRKGNIQIGRCTPEGAFTLAKGSRWNLRQALMGCARLAYNNKTHLVPGIPEARDEMDAVGAAVDFSRRLKAKLDRKGVAK